LIVNSHKHGAYQHTKWHFMAAISWYCIYLRERILQLFDQKKKKKKKEEEEEQDFRFCSVFSPLISPVQIPSGIYKGSSLPTVPWS
jgi:hypothetical protein